MSIKIIGKDEIAALIPEYLEGKGDVTRVIYQDGSELIINYSITSVIKHYVKLFAQDFKSISTHYGQFVKRVISVPLPLTVKRVMIPIKLRNKPIGKDPAIGYVNMNNIYQFFEENNITIIQLTSKTELTAYHRSITIQDQMNKGSFILTKFREQVGVEEQVNLRTCPYLQTNKY